jgi:hypothetical protein
MHYSNSKNVLPVFATRWQHVFQMCLVTFIYQQITKGIKPQQTLKLDKKKIRTELESLQFQSFFDVYMAKGLFTHLISKHDFALS